MRGRSFVSLTICALVAAASFDRSSRADIVFQATNNNGFFTPFSSSTPAGVKYGDSGWIGSGGGPYALTSITLGLIVDGGTFDGSTDIKFTFNDGDPSGLGFGPGTQLYATTIPNVTLPATEFNPVKISLTIPLPSVLTSGGFNNIGWSIGVQNFNYDGDFGFQCAAANAQLVGFYTNNASFYNGTNWSLFSFGADPNTGVANFVATVETPEPGSAMILGIAGLATLSRRRTQH